MLNQLKSQWNTILTTMRNEHDISSVSFQSWIEPLIIHSIKDNVLILIVPNEHIGISFISKKYYLPLKVTIQEITGFPLDVKFVHRSDIDEEVVEDSSYIEENFSNTVSRPLLDDIKREANIDPNKTFENFVVGGNNNYAHAYSITVAENPGQDFNPLFIHGGAGLGKTHLLHAIGNYILDHNPNAKVRYVNSENFTNDVIKALRAGTQSNINELREKYRNIDLFIIDDIQFIIGKERSQEEFFHTFNSLYEAKKQIVISSDKPPKNLESLEERFRSRFAMGLIVDISSPDYETRMAILKKKAERDLFKIDDTILQYISDNIKSNIRELEGALNKVIAFSRVSKQEIDIEMAKSVLKDIISPNSTNVITHSSIISIVSDHFGISKDDLTSQKRNHSIVIARKIAIYLCRTLTNTSLESIGESFSKDHSTVSYAIESLLAELETNDNLRNTVDIIKKKIIPN